MSLKLVNLVFQCGGIFGLTPIKIESAQVVFPSKIYAFLWILLLTAGVTISAMYKQSHYKKYTSIQFLVKISNDILLFSFNIFTIITTQREKSSWLRIINLLKATEDKIDGRFWYLPFLLANLLFFIIQSYGTVLWINQLGVPYLKEYIIEFLEFYTQFIITFLMFVILKLLLQKYGTVYNNLLELSKIKVQANYCFALKKTRNHVCILIECVDIFNDIFGWLILQIVGCIFLDLLMFFYDVIDLENSPEIIAYAVIWMIWYSVSKYYAC